MKTNQIIPILVSVILFAAVLAASGCASFIAEPSKIETASAGGVHTAVLTENGSLWMLGRTVSHEAGSYLTENIPIRVMENIVCADCGDGITAAIDRDGVLWAWGRGIGCDETVPTRLMNGAACVSCGSGVIAVIDTEARLWVFELNDGIREPRMMLTDVRSVSCGGDHIAAVLNDGTLWSWGSNGHGQLGDGTLDDSPVPVEVCGIVR